MHESHTGSARDFLSSLIDSPIKLPCDPALLSTLFIAMSDNSWYSMQDLAGLVASNQGLAAKALSVANSACYGLLTSVTTLERAVQVLGILDLRSLVLMFGLSGAFPPRELPDDFPTRQLWEHQLRTAKIGRRVSAIIQESDPGAPGLPEPESVYAAGILHDVGKIVLAHRRPDDWRNISAIKDAKGIDMAQAEDEYWGMDHGSVGGIIMSDWNMPGLLSDMVSWHHHPFLADDHQFAVRILAAANVLAEKTLPPESCLSEEEAALPGKALPPDFLELLPGYEMALGRRYGEFADILADGHTGAFVGAV